MNENYPSSVLKAAQKIKLLLLDVDVFLQMDDFITVMPAKN